MNFFHYLLILFFAFFCFSCEKVDKKKLFVIENTPFFSLSDEYGLVHRKAVSILEEEFDVLAVKVSKYEGIVDEFKKIFEIYPNASLFVEPFLAPVLVHYNTPKDETDCVIITYGDYNEINKSNIPLFNITYDEEILFKKIDSLVFSGDIQTGSIIIAISQNASYLEYFKTSRIEDSTEDKVRHPEDVVEFLTVYTNTDSKELKKKIEGNEKIKKIILYAGINNRMINMIDKNLLRKIKIIEIQTNYKRVNSVIDNRIYIDYELLVKEGLKSNEFKTRSFIDNSTKVINYISVNKKIIKID